MLENLTVTTALPEEGADKCRNASEY